MTSCGWCAPGGPSPRTASGWQHDNRAGAERNYVYDGDTLLLNQGKDRFLPGPDGQILVQNHLVTDANGPAGRHWLLTDYQGSVKYVITDTGLSAPITYDSFGNLTGGTTPYEAGSLFGYTGQFFDVETGLSYHHARYYDSASGRWLSEDPSGFDGGDTNLYRYVGNNPVNRIDPTGLRAQSLGGAFTDYTQFANVKLNIPGVSPPRSSRYLDSVFYDTLVEPGFPDNYFEPVNVAQQGFFGSLSSSVGNAASYAGTFISSLAGQGYDTASDVAGGLYDLATVADSRAAFGEAFRTTRVEPLGERFYNVSRNLGYTDAQIGDLNSLALTPAVLGDFLQTNQAVEAYYNVDLGSIGAGRTLAPVERLQRAVQVGSVTLGGTAAGLKAAGINPRISVPSSITRRAPNAALVEQARDALGRFAPKVGGEVAPGSIAESTTWEAIANKPGWTVTRGRIYVRDATGQVRAYDGVATSPSGRNIGIEVKSSTGRLTPQQRAFDTRLNSSRDNTATGFGQNRNLTIQRAIEVRR